ncbi:unnamed protein product [Paramecium sonneborni]|uniref:Uncharacterized protein n=1 Tax=Paramecium sonneborni TaxID=65129 RepID=A0A8S1RNR0_9CILI|nr:unnamed protein product [Paramecium sonneborni]
MKVNHLIQFIQQNVEMEQLKDLNNVMTKILSMMIIIWDSISYQNKLQLGQL